jgi:hypothetical protein
LAASASTVGDSSIIEDADSINMSKSVEVGDVSTNSVKVVGTGITGNVLIRALTLRKKSVTFRIGSDTGSDLVDSQSEKDVWENNIGALHITAIKCRTDTGTSTINIARNTGSPTNILSSSLVCTDAGASSTSFTAGLDAIAVGNMLDFVLVQAATSGTPKRITVTISALLDSDA